MSLISTPQMALGRKIEKKKKNYKGGRKSRESVQQKLGYLWSFSLPGVPRAIWE